MQNFKIFIHVWLYLSQSRTELENHSVDASTTSEAVSFITLLQELKRKVRSWEENVEVCVGGWGAKAVCRLAFPLKMNYETFGSHFVAV